MLTNNNNTPEIIQTALDMTPYENSGDYSATQIIKDTTEVVLGKRYFKDISTDISDMGNKFIGTAVHFFLQQASKGIPYLETERVQLTEVEGVVLKGQFDYYNTKTKTIGDYKTAKTYKYTRGDFSAYEKQLNIYAYQMRVAGQDVDNLEVVMIFKDWNSKFMKEGYPESFCVTVPITLWSFEEQEKFVKGQIQKIIEAEGIDDDKLSACTDKWETPDIYRVYKPGVKTAKKKTESKEEAEKWIAAHQKDGVTYTIDIEKGVPKKCLDWCDVREFCPFYKKYIKENI